MDGHRDASRPHQAEGERDDEDRLARVIHCEHGWWFPERDGPDYGIWESNANLLTDNRGPFDPQMGTYQLRGLLCRVEKLTPENDHFGPPELETKMEAETATA